MLRSVPKDADVCNILVGSHDELAREINVPARDCDDPGRDNNDIEITNTNRDIEGDATVDVVRGAEESASSRH